jgi:cytidylate kinase
MAPHVHSAIQALIQSVSGLDTEKKPKSGYPFVVTISRDHGCSGDEIAERLAQRLGVPLYSKEILDKIAERTHVDPAVVKQLDEAVGKARDLWLYSLFTGQDASADTYKKHMINVILTLSRTGGVIIGRGAHIVLGRTSALRVRITGSPDVCAQRLAKAEDISLEEAKKHIHDVNHQRGKFVWDAFHARLSDPTSFDLVVNTDRLGDIEHVVEMLHNAAQAVTVGEPV